MGQQRERIEGVADTVNELDDKVAKSRVLVIGFAKRMASDRCIQILTFLNCLLVCIIIMYVVVYKKGLGKPSSSDASSSDNSSSTSDTVAGIISHHNSSSTRNAIASGSNGDYSVRGIFVHMIIPFLLHP